MAAMNGEHAEEIDTRAPGAGMSPPRAGDWLVASDDAAPAEPDSERGSANEVDPGLAAQRLDASHELSRTWARSVVDITFPVAGRDVRLDTEHRLGSDRPDDLLTVHGRIGRSAFAFELTRPLFSALTGPLPDPVDIEALSGEDAALLVEHMLTDALAGVEGEIGEQVVIEEVEREPLVTELEPIIGALWIGKERHILRAVFGDPLHMRILTEWLRPMTMADEFDAGALTRVEIGPIVLEGEDLDGLEVGDALAIGTEPGKNLIGRLVRPTGRTVPVAIDTSQVIVSGPLLDVEQSLAVLSHPDEVSLGVEIGTVRMTPTHLRRAGAGNRFIMERNPDNTCALWLDDEVVARGELTLIDGQLAVEVRSLGDAPLPAKSESRTAIAAKPSSSRRKPEPEPEPEPVLDASEGGAFDDQEEADAIENAPLPTATREAVR